MGRNEDKSKINNNIENYLQWRGDITFDKDPFNEVDSAILCELAYVDFGDIVKGCSLKKSVKINTIYKKYFTKHTVKEILSRENFVKMAPLIMEKIVKAKRFENLKVVGYREIVDEKKQCQFVSVIYEVGDGTYYFAFGGTDTSIVGWKEDFNLSWSAATGGQKEAVKYINQIFENRKCKIRVGGHSKGGNFAIYASAFSGIKVKKQIIEIYTYDSPGFIKEIIDCKQYKNIVSKVNSIIPECSMIGMMFENTFKSKIIKSSNEGLMQHDLLSWQVMGNGFVEADGLTKLAKFINNTIKKWIVNLDNDTRKTFTDTLFSLFEATGSKNFEDICKKKFNTVTKIVEATGGLTKEKRKMVFDILKSLFIEYGKSVVEAVKPNKK